ncbi:hypothetical protein ES288_A05G331100v1, partial [Gossypium darwinii]
IDFPNHLAILAKTPKQIFPQIPRHLKLLSRPDHLLITVLCSLYCVPSPSLSAAVTNSFMNFSRYTRCLKCKAEGPKRVVTDDVQMKKEDWNYPGNIGTRVLVLFT